MSSFTDALVGLYTSERAYAHDGFTQLMGGTTAADVAAAEAAAQGQSAAAAAAAAEAAGIAAQSEAIGTAAKYGAVGLGLVALALVGVTLAKSGR